MDICVRHHRVYLSILRQSVDAIPCSDETSSFHPVDDGTNSRYRRVQVCSHTSNAGAEKGTSFHGIALFLADDAVTQVDNPVRVIVNNRVVAGD